MTAVNKLPVWRMYGRIADGRRIQGAVNAASYEEAAALAVNLGGFMSVDPELSYQADPETGKRLTIVADADG